MIIKPKNSEISQFILYGTEHFIVSLSTFLLSFFILFYIGLNIEGKYHQNILTYLLSHDLYFTLILIGLTLIANSILFVKNSSKLSVREFIFDKTKTLRVRYRKGYSNIDHVTSSSISNVIFVKTINTNYIGDEIKVININFDGNIHFTLNLEDAIWSTDKDALYELYDLIDSHNSL